MHYWSLKYVQTYRYNPFARTTTFSNGLDEQTARTEYNRLKSDPTCLRCELRYLGEVVEEF